jgi:hypothetical protein
VLRIRDVIPDPNFFPARIHIKEFKILTQKIVSKLSELLSGLFIPDTDPGFLTIPDPGVKKGTGSRIRIRNTDCGAGNKLSKQNGQIINTSVTYVPYMGNSVALK